MATQSTLRNPWKPLLHPQHTPILCPKNLCPTLDFIDNFALDFCRSSAEYMGSKASQCSAGGIRFLSQLPEHLLP